MTFRIRGLDAGQFSHLSPGDEVILVNYEHHAVESPYRMRFASA